MRLIVSGGGTGGHIYPGMAVAEEVIAGSSDNRVLFIGTDRSADRRAFYRGGFQSAILRCHGLKGKSFGPLLKSLIRLPLSLIQALRMVYKFKPDLVLGVGGYVTGPVLLAANILLKPTCIHEQNSVPGLANRLIGKFVDRIFITYPDSEKYFPAGKCILTGNPVRREIADLAENSPLREEQLPGREGFTLGILGGSLGAHRLNTLMVEGLLRKKEFLPENFLVLHQTGAADEKAVRKAYDSASIGAQVADFFEDMVDFYSRVDLIVSRAGATSLAEMTVLGIPMILIPYPFATDDHQEKNAEYMVRGGAAKMFPETGLTESELVETVLLLMADKEKRLEMAASAKALARPDAVTTIVKECEKIINK